MLVFLTWIAKAVFGVVPGLATSYMKHQENRAIQGTKRQQVWAQSVTIAAQTDVENRKVAAQERMNHPILLAMYVLVLAGPVLYYLVFWMDTIFAGQDWGFINWGSFNLPRAPARLEEMGVNIINVFIGGTVAVGGVTKTAKILANSGLFRGK
jgi:hypothetical protein